MVNMGGRPLKTVDGEFAGQALKEPNLVFRLTDGQRELVEAASRKWREENGGSRSDWCRHALVKVAKLELK